MSTESAGRPAWAFSRPLGFSYAFFCVGDMQQFPQDVFISEVHESCIGSASPEELLSFRVGLVQVDFQQWLSQSFTSQQTDG